jgi:hypothetical protein
MQHDLRDVGGTRGGLGMFIVGAAMFVGGLYLLFQQIDVHGGYWGAGGWGGGGNRSFGLTLIPLLGGIGVLFWNGSSRIGWALTAGGLLILVLGIIVNMQIHWRQTTLFDALLMLVLIAGGLGVMARSLKASGNGIGVGRNHGRDRDTDGDES